MTDEYRFKGYTGPLMDCAVSGCIRMLQDRITNRYSGGAPEWTSRRIIRFFSELPAGAVRSYVECTLITLTEYFTDDYLQVALEYELELTKRTPLSEEELVTIILLKTMLPKALLEKDVDFFHTVVAEHCGQAVRSEWELISHDMEPVLQQLAQNLAAHEALTPEERKAKNRMAEGYISPESLGCKIE